MHIKVRGKAAAALYRSRWVKKGAEGNSHGFAVQSYVGSIALNAQAVPDELRSKLTPAEVSYLEKEVCEPARREAETRRRAEEERAGCPLWRLEAAARLVQEAAECSSGKPVPAAQVAVVARELDKVRAAGTRDAGASQGRTDLLRDALAAVKAAALAVQRGDYGKGPTQGVKSTYAYKRWAEIGEAVGGDSEDSLLRALQAKGYVKRR